MTRPIALVSGGNRGIGRATVLRLVSDGYDVAFCYRRDADSARSLEKEVAEAGAQAIGRQVDVTDPAAVNEWVAAVEKEIGPIQVAVTSAGIIKDAPTILMKDEDWHSVIDINLSGTFNVCRAAAFPMVRRRSGSIVNISSVVGIHGNVAQSNYAASKAGIFGFTKALSKEVGRFGVRVNAIAPGFIQTDMVSGLTEARKNSALERLSLQRFGVAEDVAHAVGYLVEAGYVTGSVLVVDGGLSL
ncbi:3-oxoacyl-ACP reductase FabG [Kineosporia sp. NBRC 101731]|uniref:3-oxoacyl-ACP reductase FabG n=1 Tax=Kineosporia sp. NBRC 101731 TaxID=3032199 RepID=UPI0024A3A9D4|nr:3-oxoacyl-ACP reductase FabG [Kineosporia sp. NBRC 101731]GLY32469.1 3-oxoacyl-[acyl-carrier-protein] reductase [Kineosporia sp. NBRC 101731]